MGKRTISLTNEKLVADRFESLFELVNYAIGVATDKIVSGRETYVTTDVRNTAYQVLREIEEGKDLFEPIAEDEEELEENNGEIEGEPVDLESTEAAV
ncbi:Uncharacterized protein SCG7086_AA_00030 [Chlamydiales bacterium SCGC AG-110-P3]|nr:Uncharacterized protein SCG7086_AA_00030 [Chlamydiales bacterium SCGC AG-110-P3]